jgi:hypothetical protein
MALKGSEGIVGFLSILTIFRMWGAATLVKWSSCFAYSVVYTFSPGITLEVTAYQSSNFV